MGQLEQEDSVEETVGVEEQKRKKQMKVVEELIMTETRYCDDISQLLATMQSLERMVCISFFSGIIHKLRTIMIQWYRSYVDIGLRIYIFF